MPVEHRYRIPVSLCETSKDYGLSPIKHLSRAQIFALGMMDRFPTSQCLVRKNILPFINHTVTSGRLRTKSTFRAQTWQLLALLFSSMKFFKQQSGDGPNFLGTDHFVSLTGSHCNLTPTGWGSSNSLPNPISSNTNPEPLSGRERCRDLLTSSTISFWSQTAPRGGKSVEDEDLKRLTRSGERYCPP